MILNQGKVVPHRVQRHRILTIIEGINDGWTALNWIVLAVSIVFGAQSALVLTKSGSPPS